MNYEIFMTGAHFDTFDIIVKLFIHSSNESDYKVKCFSSAPDNFKSSMRLKIKLTGSLKNQAEYIMVDFDHMVVDVPEECFYLSPDKLDVEYSANASHYWHLLGALISKLQDVSPAYITGYLLENEMEKELAVFRKYLS